MTKQKNTIVEIRNLYKSYHRESLIVPVLYDITFDIAEGEFLALMGPSGSGKTTLLNLIAGIDKADKGSIHVGEVDITTLSETELAHWRANNVGFIFQFYNLIPVLKAIENVELPLHLTSLPTKERHHHAEMALSMVGLAHRMDHYPSEMSGGEQQRVAIARAIVNDPAFLLADEPTGNLDTEMTLEVMSIFQALNDRGKTIVMVTHEPELALYTRRTIILRDGGLVSDEPVHAPRRAAEDLAVWKEKHILLSGQKGGRS
jgi:putative ABC transport system ATP-binding protein